MSWMSARRAIVRSPLDRMGYGGYLSLAIQFPEFVDRMEAIVNEFRDIYEAARGERPLNAPVRVGVVNAWGKVRSWMTHMVAHALPFEQTEAYVGVLESLAGLPFEVEFLSFDELRNGVPEGIDVVLNVGEAGTAYSGGVNWADQKLQASLRRFVAQGGGFIGVGEPAAYPAHGAFSQMSDVLGVDQEQSLSLSTDRYPTRDEDHFIVRGEGAVKSLSLNVAGGSRFWVPVTPSVCVVRSQGTSVHAAVNEYGQGRAVYLAGLPFSQENARVLAKSIFWAAGQESAYEAGVHADDPRVDVAEYADGSVFVYNSSMEPVTTIVRNVNGTDHEVELGVLGSQWFRPGQ